MFIGWFAGKIKMVGPQFFVGINKMVFFVFFPATLFRNLYNADLAAVFHPGLVGYFMIGTLIIYILSWLIGARFLEKRKLAVFVQAGHRSNYLVLAAAVVVVLLGEEAMPQATLMMPIVVAFYTILAAIVFIVTGQSEDISGLQRLKGVVIGTLKVPIIIATFVSLLANLSNLYVPEVMDRSLASLSAMAAPAALIGVGGTLSMEKVRRNFRLSIASAAMKNVIVPIVFITPAVFLGFRGVELAIIAMLGLSPIATATYNIAVEMGGDGDAAASCLVLSNALALLTIVPGLTILRALELF